MSDQARLEKFPQLTPEEQLRLYKTSVEEVRRYREGLKVIWDITGTVPGAGPTDIATRVFSLTESLLNGEDVTHG